MFHGVFAATTALVAAHAKGSPTRLRHAAPLSAVCTSNCAAVLAVLCGAEWTAIGLSFPSTEKQAVSATIIAAYNPACESARPSNGGKGR